MKIPFLNLKARYLELKPELDMAYQRVMESGWYILGKEVEAFEQEFADYCGVKHCIGVGNGFFSPNDVRRLENMDLIPDEKGGNDFYLNGSYNKLQDAGVAYAKNIPETEE